MIVVEGGDNTGKSTLVSQLIELDPQLRLLKRDRYRADLGETIASSYLRALLPEDGDRVAHSHSVADRLMASECIYGELFRNGCRMNEAEHFAIQNMLNSYHAIVVHCNPPDEAIQGTWKDRAQLYDHDPIPIAEAYRERMDEIFKTRDVIRYDWTSSHSAKHRTEIVALHQLAQKAVAESLSWWSAMPAGVGTLTSPRFVFIGETLSPRAITEVPFANGPAGSFLAWAISETGNREAQRSMYLTNAGSSNNSSVLREELRRVVGPHTTIITLGKIAERTINFLLDTIPPPAAVANLPHPMYWRRFRWNDRQEYVELLRRTFDGEDE